MFDEKLTRARHLIEQRDQIDQELRVLFGELPQPKRTRRRIEKENGSGLEPEKENSAATSNAQH
jgi:hypothetical protein